MVIQKDFYVDKLRVRVFDTRGEMGVCAGTEAALKIKKLYNQYVFTTDRALSFLTFKDVKYGKERFDG